MDPHAETEPFTAQDCEEALQALIPRGSGPSTKLYEDRTLEGLLQYVGKALVEKGVPKKDAVESLSILHRLFEIKNINRLRDVARFSVVTYDVLSRDGWEERCSDHINIVIPNRYYERIAAPISPFLAVRRDDRDEIARGFTALQREADEGSEFAKAVALLETNELVRAGVFITGYSAACTSRSTTSEAFCGMMANIFGPRSTDHVQDRIKDISACQHRCYITHLISSYFGKGGLLLDTFSGSETFAKAVGKAELYAPWVSHYLDALQGSVLQPLLSGEAPKETINLTHYHNPINEERDLEFMMKRRKLDDPL